MKKASPKDEVQDEYDLVTTKTEMVEIPGDGHESDSDILVRKAAKREKNEKKKLDREREERERIEKE